MRQGSERRRKVVGPRLGHGKATLGSHTVLRPPAIFTHVLTSLSPLLPFPAFNIQSIGVCYPSVSPNFDHVLFGTFPVEIRRRSPLRFSPSLPRALPSALGPFFVHTNPSSAEITKINLYTTTILSHGPKPKCRPWNCKSERKARA